MNRSSYAPNSSSAVLLLILFLFAAYVVNADERATVWSGAYTEEQAQRGVQTYQEWCQSCHASDMRGGAAIRGLTGTAFQFLWEGKTLDELYSAMIRMPPGSQGTLSDQAYIDILAAVLQQNGFPPGGTEVEADIQALQSILLTWKTSRDDP